MSSRAAGLVILTRWLAAARIHVRAQPPQSTMPFATGSATARERPRDR